MQKFLVEAGLAGLKILHFSGRLLAQSFRIISGFFRLLFKGLIYKILAKIYYGIFRLKKNDLTGQALKELLRNKLVYLLIFLLTAGFVFANLTGQTKAGAAGPKISKTILANLVTADSEFDGQAVEELIVDTTGPSELINPGPAKYQDNSCTLEKQPGLIVEENVDENSYPSFNDGGDLVYKPLGANPNVDSGTGTNSVGPQRTNIIYYVVQPGDTVSSIAKNFNLTINTILWANSLTAYTLIRPGDKLTILPYSGILYTVKTGDTVSKIAAKYGVEIDSILSCNDLAAGLKAGQKIIVPGAKQIAEPSAIARATTNYTGLSAIRDLVKQPATKSVGSKMIWPTVGYRLTQYFSYRHPGVDIGNKVGTPIYAADDGVVEIASGGWNGGYGNTIVINHGGGVKTRYGHASKLFVKVGEVVEKGENIAAMGSTGRSTGAHLHFEVLINKVRYNPLNYIR